MERPFTHVVVVEPRKHFASATLPATTVERLRAAFCASRWWRDAWTSAPFRSAARDVLHEHGSLVLLGPRMPFEVPPPFEEFFEPVEVAVGLGDNTEQLKTISGEKPTKEERGRWVLMVLLVVSVLAFLIPLGVAFLRGMPPRAALVIAALVLIVGMVVAGIASLQRLSGRWYLVPGAIAVVRRPVRRGQPARVTVLSRADSVLAFRYVSTGKTTVLIAELWTHAGKRLHRPVTQREAVSIIAAWQSPLAPPVDERLQELAW